MVEIDSKDYVRPERFHRIISHFGYKRVATDYLTNINSWNNVRSCICIIMYKYLYVSILMFVSWDINFLIGLFCFINYLMRLLVIV